MPSPLPSETPASVRAVAEALPKVQIHLHLDGSLSPPFLYTLSQKVPNPPLPASPGSLRPHLLSLKKRAGTSQQKNKNWSAFTLCNVYLQTAAALHAAAADITSRMLVKNVRVLEIRFCPTLHVERGLSVDEAVGAVIGGYKSVVGGKCVRGGVIVVGLRSYGVAHVAEMARVAERWHGDGVIGFDIAGDEEGYGLPLFEDVLKGVKVPMSLHAGEWGKGGKENVRIAVAVGARRIGHGLALGGDEGLCCVVKNAGVFVEVCLTSNCVGRGKIEENRFDLHPVGEMLERGVRVAGLNCDNLLLSGTEEFEADPVEEIVRARIGCGLSWRDIGEILKDGCRACFDDMGSEEERRRFEKQFERDIDSVLAEVVQHEEPHGLVPPATPLN